MELFKIEKNIIILLKRFHNWLYKGIIAEWLWKHTHIKFLFSLDYPVTRNEFSELQDLSFAIPNCGCFICTIFIHFTLLLSLPFLIWVFHSLLDSQGNLSRQPLTICHPLNPPPPSDPPTHQPTPPTHQPPPHMSAGITGFPPTFLVFPRLFSRVLFR